MTKRGMKHGGRFRIAVGDVPHDGGYIVGKGQAEAIRKKFRFEDDYPLHQSLDACVCRFVARRAYRPPSKNEGARTAVEQQEYLANLADTFERALDLLSNAEQQILELIDEQHQGDGATSKGWYSRAVGELRGVCAAATRARDEHRASITRGRPSDESLTLLFEELRLLWLEGTRRPDTVSRNADRYGGDYFEFMKLMLDIAGVKRMSDQTLGRRLERLRKNTP